jgi:hypothetical protein
MRAIDESPRTRYAGDNMKATILAALLGLFVGLFVALTAPLVARASDDFPHAPVTMASGLDMSRATIPVDVDGHRYACVLDTGTSAMLVSQSVAQSVGLKPEVPIDEIAPDGLRYADWHTHLAQFAVAGYWMHDLPALISSKLAGNTVLCGYDFFAQIPTLIDRDRQLVTLFPTIATLDRMHCMPVDLRPRVPVARVQVNGAWIDNIVLDSGMVGGAAIWNGALRQMPPAPAAPGFACGFNATIGFLGGSAASSIPMCTSMQPPDGYNGIVETNLPAVHALAIDYPNRRMCFTL